MGMTMRQPKILLAGLLLLSPFSALAERKPVAAQIQLPHNYYYREMYLPQVTSGPSALTFSPDGKELVYSMGGSLWRQTIGDDHARELTHAGGYDYQPVRDELTQCGLAAEIPRRGLPAPIQVGQRWVVERSHAWLNAFGKLRWCTERRWLCVAFYVALACVIVIVRRLIRRVWTHYRWDTRPRRRP